MLGKFFRKQLSKEFIDSLIGLDLKEAEKKVRNKWYEPSPVPDGYVTDASIHKNTVTLFYNENNKIVHAYSHGC